ncbi:MAG: hypothetical protein H6Q73_3236 [Firmicutes bacterium]|nr:hypothetical protein [Bacillota bacterium]
MQQFGKVLGPALKKMGLDKRYKVEKIFFYWQNIVGGEIAAHSFPGSVNRGVLIVKVNNSVWIHHLMTLKENIVAKINDFIGEKVIYDIKFQAGYLKNYQNNSEVDDEKLSLRSENVILSKSDIEKADGIANLISDVEIRLKIKRILCKEFAFRKVKEKHKWKKCSQCGTLCPQDQIYCTVCDINNRRRIKREIRKLLNQAPWLDYKECTKYIDCRITDFVTIKNELIDKIRKDINNDHSDSMKIAIAAMLIYGIKPEAITKEFIDGNLDKIRGKKNVFTFRR